MVENSYSFACDYCQAHYEIAGLEVPAFCAICGKSKQIKPLQEVSFPAFIGRYKILESIGKGGMGEVFLAYDTSCERRLALKRIRPDLIQHSQIQNRFLKEAHITCQLTHPAIIPIYTIHKEGSYSYYTMPFVEGKTLKQIIRTTKKQEKNQEEGDRTRESIPGLMRIFVIICQAIAYAHSRGVLHRDLKLENIIVGKYGEVLILDWGLAKFINSASDDEGTALDYLPSASQHMDITRLGKVVGTIPYMAPERAYGHPSSIQSDIYSLGVILYQLLTLRSPFKRGKRLEEFRRSLPNEELIDPITVAPYRDVPRLLSRMTTKCLEVDISKRYQSVDDLIRDLETYLEGRSEWFYATQLDINQKDDWEFQENVLIAEHIAITRSTEEAQWVSLMISRQSFTGNTKIETEVCLGEQGHGLGILLSIPEVSERKHISDGYCLWLGSDINHSTKLLRSNVEVFDAPDIFLKRHQWYRIRIEKIEKTIHVYINHTLQFSYVAHLPLIGTHIGLLSRDVDFKIQPVRVSVGSLNIMVNCLAVPDAFLAHQDFHQALSEYRRIAYSFPDRLEGREAIFRAGLTLIEQSKKDEGKNKQLLLDEALNEFKKLHDTPGAPLEYLGKALVYHSLKEYLEEVKCFELAYRRFPKHPLLSILQEHLLLRMHELSRSQRIATYQFILLSVRYLPLNAIDTHTRKLFISLQKHWEHLVFIEGGINKDLNMYQSQFAIQLAFWLAKPYILGEIIDDLTHKSASSIEIGNALFALIELGAWQYAKNKLQELKTSHPSIELSSIWTTLFTAIACEEKPLEEAFSLLFPSPLTVPDFHRWRSIYHYLNLALKQEKTAIVYRVFQQFAFLPLSFEEQIRLHFYIIWAYLLDKNWQAAGKILYTYPIELLSKESTPLHFLYGCWLQATEGKEMAFVHFTGILSMLYPRSWTLASHYLIGELLEGGYWFEQAFLWEKRQLYCQLALYFHCAGETEQAHYYKTLYHQMFTDVES